MIISTKHGGATEGLNTRRRADPSRAVNAVCRSHTTECVRWAREKKMVNVVKLTVVSDVGRVFRVLFWFTRSGDIHVRLLLLR